MGKKLTVVYYNLWLEYICTKEKIVRADLEIKLSEKDKICNSIG